jgi:phosphoserine phosphatase RsbU/P
MVGAARVLTDAVHADAVAEVLALACDVAGGGSLAVVDADGTVVAGTLPGGPAAAHCTRDILLDGRVAGRIVAPSDAPEALLALLARTLELAVGSAGEAVARARLAEELAIGRRIQRALIPRRFPDVPGWSFAAAYEAAREVGGDLYDAFPLRGRPDQYGLLVADVTGKGIPAALLMADVRALLHAATDNADGPADALTRVNRILVRERQTALFVTAALVTADATTGEVRFASAGHESPVVARASKGELVELDAAGPLLGAFEDAVFEERNARIDPGDALVLYTDGVTDTRDAARAFFGEDRLRATIGATCGEHAQAMVDAIMGAVLAFRGEAEAFDDLTLLVAERDAV